MIVNVIIAVYYVQSTDVCQVKHELIDRIQSICHYIPAVNPASLNISFIRTV